MLYTLDDKRVTSIPHPDTYSLLESRMDLSEIDAAIAYINSIINDDLEKGTEIQTAGWMPGADWVGTPLESIYEKAARRNPDLAGRIFGLLVWRVFMERPERWVTGRFGMNGEELSSLTYFMPQN